MRYHITLVRISVATTNKSINNDIDEDVEKRQPSCTVARNADGCSHCGKQYADTSKNYKWFCLLTHFWELSKET